jgi:hypothetical protein
MQRNSLSFNLNKKKTPFQVWDRALRAVGCARRGSRR